MVSGQPRSDRILRLITGYWATGILGSAATHSVFTHIEKGATTVDQVATRAGISHRGAQALLDGLVSVGLVEVHDGKYHNTAEASAFLVEGRPECLSGFATLKLGHMTMLTDLPDVVRAGGPLTSPVVEVADNPHWEDLVQALAALSAPVARIAADRLGLAERQDLSILDIGGGSGIYSAIWLGVNPTARSTQLDWAPINAIARRLLGERGVADRVRYLDGDFHTTEIGHSTYDIAVYSNIAHQEGPEENVAILTKVREALKPGGTLVIADYVVEDDRSGAAFPLMFAAEMLLKSRHGNTWRRADYRDWLAKAGFDDVDFQPTPSPATLILAR